MFQLASVVITLLAGHTGSKEAAPIRVSVNQPQTATAPAPSQNGAQ